MAGKKGMAQQVLCNRFFCMGYQCYFNYRRGWRALYMVKHANYHLPRNFLFKGSKDELVQYIEDLCYRRARADEMEERGYAYDHTYDQAPKVGDKPPLVHISPQRLRQVLEGKDPLCMPALCGIKLVQHNGSGVATPSQILAAIVSTDVEKELQKATDLLLKEAAARGCSFRWKYLDRCVHAELIPWKAVREDGTIDEDELKPEEQPIIDHVLDNGAREVISLLINQGPTQFFGRSVTYQGTVIYRASSYSLEGPWETIEAIPELCAMLGIDLPQQHQEVKQ